MAQPSAQIPGYYYDREKKKYFKILKTTRGLNVAYSSEDVKRRNNLDSIADEHTRSKERETGRINQSRILNSTLHGGLLAREYGRIRVDTSKVLAPRLELNGRIKIESSCPPTDQSNNFFDVIQTQGQGYTSSLVLVNDNEFSISNFGVDDDSNKYLELRDHMILRPHQPMGPLTSLSTNNFHQVALSTSFGCSTHLGLRLVKLQNLGDSISTLIEQECSFGALRIPDRSRRHEIDVLCSTFAPSTSPLLFAIGTSHGIMTINSHPKIKDGQSFYAAHRNNEKLSYSRKMDVLAMDFLIDNPHVLLSGNRRGMLICTDIREKFESLANNTAIKHCSTISHIKSLDTYRIIVAGLESSLCQYDLRLIKNFNHHNTIFTRPTLSYNGHHNDGTIGLGFDVDIEGGLIAAAQETHAGHNPIRLFSIHDENFLDSPFEHISFDQKNGTNDVVKCIRFAKSSQGASKSLYIGRGNEIFRYS